MVQGDLKSVTSMVVLSSVPPPGWACGGGQREADRAANGPPGPTGPGPARRRRPRRTSRALSVCAGGRPGRSRVLAPMLRPCARPARLAPCGTVNRGADHAVDGRAPPPPCSRTKPRTPATLNGRPACQWAASTSACVGRPGRCDSCRVSVCLGVPKVEHPRSPFLRRCPTAPLATTGAGGAAFPVAGPRSRPVTEPPNSSGRPVPGSGVMASGRNTRLTRSRQAASRSGGSTSPVANAISTTITPVHHTVPALGARS